MPSAKDTRTQARTARPDSPFGAPNPDEVFEILIPEGAATGVIPAGDKYLGKLLSVVSKNAKSSGNPMWVFTFTLSEGPFAGMDFDLFCSLTPNSLWKLTETLAALGVPAKPGELARFVVKNVIGTGVRMVIADDKTREGRDISKLTRVLPHPEGAGYKDGKGAFVVPPSPDDNVSEEDDDLPEEKPRRGVRSRGYDEDEPEEREERVARTRRPAAEDDEEEEERPRRRRAAAEEEDDEDYPLLKQEKGKSGRATRDEEEEEEPAPRRGRGRPAGRRSRL